MRDLPLSTVFVEAKSSTHKILKRLSVHLSLTSDEAVRVRDIGALSYAQFLHLKLSTAIAAAAHKIGVVVRIDS